LFTMAISIMYACFVSFTTTATATATTTIIIFWIHRNVAGVWRVQVTNQVLITHYSAKNFQSIWDALNSVFSAWEYIDHGEDWRVSNCSVILWEVVVVVVVVVAVVVIVYHVSNSVSFTCYFATRTEQGLLEEALLLVSNTVQNVRRLCQSNFKIKCHQDVLLWHMLQRVYTVIPIC
jgi:hypothetical protein